MGSGRSVTKGQRLATELQWKAPTNMATQATATSDIDRLWGIVQATTEATNANAVQIGTLNETVRAQHDRIARIEQGPAVLRGCLGIVIAAGAGCLVPFIILGGTMLFTVVWYLLTHR